MKKLFIYSSFTGNGDLVAEVMREKGYDIRKVKEKKKFPKSFFWSVFSGGFRAGMGFKGRLIDYNNDVSTYDEIVLGSPIWCGTLPPVTNAILKKTDFSGKTLKVVFYSGSGEGKKGEAKIKKMFPNSEIIFLQEPKKHPDELKKISIL